jgi:hypothetical protein
MPLPPKVDSDEMIVGTALPDFMGEADLRPPTNSGKDLIHTSDLINTSWHVSLSVLVSAEDTDENCDYNRVFSTVLDTKIKIALSLYKVQQNIYLLDFQRVEVT